MEVDLNRLYYEFKFAIEQNDLNKVQELWREYSDVIDIDSMPVYTQQPFLHCAMIDGGDINMVKFLIETCGANVNHREKVSNDTPMMRAAFVGKIDIIRFLLESGADPTLTDDYGYTALSWSERCRNHNEIAILLTEPVTKSALKA